MRLLFSLVLRLLKDLYFIGYFLWHTDTVNQHAYFVFFTGCYFMQTPRVVLILMNFVLYFSLRGLFWSSEEGYRGSSYCMIWKLDFVLYIYLLIFSVISLSFLVNGALAIFGYCYSFIGVFILLQAVAGGLLLKLPFNTIFEYLQVGFSRCV